MDSNQRYLSPYCLTRSRSFRSAIIFHSPRLDMSSDTMRHTTGKPPSGPGSERLTSLRRHAMSSKLERLTTSTSLFRSRIGRCWMRERPSPHLVRVRLHEKGGKQHAMPCHHNLEIYLHTYIDGAGLAREPRGGRVPGRAGRALSRRQRALLGFWKMPLVASRTHCVALRRTYLCSTTGERRTC